MDIELFDFLRKLIQTEDGFILYALALIVVMEIVDFASGTFAAIVNPEVEYKSRIGINGLIRKVLGIFMLLLPIPMYVLFHAKPRIYVSVFNLHRISSFYFPIDN